MFLQEKVYILDVKIIFQIIKNSILGNYEEFVDTPVFFFCYKRYKIFQLFIKIH